MIYTSYFANLGALPSNIIPISICGKAPEWYEKWTNGFQYKKLAPKYDFFMKWKENKDNDYYISCYQEQILNKLNPETVVKELEELCGDLLQDGKSICLLCYEQPQEFCHRHLVSAWLQDNGYSCQELEIIREEDLLSVPTQLEVDDLLGQLTKIDTSED